jgi:hypothetical protein
MSSFIFEVLGLEPLQQRVTKQKRILTIVESEAHLVQVGLQTLCTSTMPRL